MHYLTCEEIRTLDRRAIEEFGIPSTILMENAAIRFCDALQRVFGSPAGHSFAIVCGMGNNGGDGFAIARHLHNSGGRITVLAVGRIADLPPDSDAGVNARIAARMEVPIADDILDQEKKYSYHLRRADFVIDALFGTGLSRPVEGLYLPLVKAMNRARRVIAVDIPSGLNGDTGEPMGTAVKALRTITFAAMKKGFASETARSWTGDIDLVDISIPRPLLPKEKEDARR